MGYLHNDICQFKMITQWDIKRKYNVISTCFFKMHNPSFNEFIEKTTFLSINEKSPASRGILMEDILLKIL